MKAAEDGASFQRERVGKAESGEGRTT